MTYVLVGIACLAVGAGIAALFFRRELRRMACLLYTSLSALLALALVRRRFAAGRVLGSGVLAAGLGAHVRAVLSVGLPSAVQMAVVNLSRCV